jgi:hypothetical protein
LNLVVGATNFRHETYGLIGVGYLLPMLIHSDLFLTHKGDLRLDLEKKFQWTKFIFSNAAVTFRQREASEWDLSLMYANSWPLAFGFKFTTKSTGVGIQYQF